MIYGRRQHLLRILALRRAHADHPDQQHNDDDENDDAGDAAGNVRKLGPLQAPWPGKRAGAPARRRSLQVLDARAAVITVVVADVQAVGAVAAEARLALALKVRRFRHQDAVRVRVAVHLALFDRFARVGALAAAGRADGLGRVVRRARDARRLLRLGLVEALAALDAGVERSVQVGARLADGQRALLDRRGADLRGGAAQRAVGAGRLDALRAECAARARFAAAVVAQLLAGGALVAALVTRDGLGRFGRLAEAAQLARERSLVGLIETVAARSAQAALGVQVFARRAAFCDDKQTKNFFF